MGIIITNSNHTNSIINIQMEMNSTILEIATLLCFELNLKIDRNKIKFFNILQDLNIFSYFWDYLYLFPPLLYELHIYGETLSSQLALSNDSRGIHSFCSRLSSTRVTAANLPESFISGTYLTKCQRQKSFIWACPSAASPMSSFSRARIK